MKLCINCKHVYDAGNLGFEKCSAPQNLKPADLVNGHNQARYTYCSLHRVDGTIVSIGLGTCGKRGRWYEPK